MSKDERSYYFCRRIDPDWPCEDLFHHTLEEVAEERLSPEITAMVILLDEDQEIVELPSEDDGEPTLYRWVAIGCTDPWTAPWAILTDLSFDDDPDPDDVYIFPSDEVPEFKIPDSGYLHFELFDD